MDCYKDKAVAVFTNIYMGNTKVPYQNRYKKSKKDTLEHLDKMINDSKNDTEKKYWESIKHYTNKIDICRKHQCLTSK
jgi:predicted metallo-beta-lactamase superfamily hydrolase